MDVVVVRGDPACLSTASCSLVWAALARSLGKQTVITETLFTIVDKPFTGSVDQPRVDILTSSSYCAS
jgi:phosphoserine phosphatase